MKAQEQKPLLSTVENSEGRNENSSEEFSTRANQANHPRTSSLTSYFTSHNEVGGNNSRRSMSQDYGSLPTRKIMGNETGLSRSVELTDRSKKLTPMDEFSDEISSRIHMTMTVDHEKASNRVGRNFHGQFNNVIPSHVLSGGKMVKSGRQRKKIAARTKGGEFQARRKKRRLYFCCIGSEIDIEKLADHFLVENKDELDGSTSLNAKDAKGNQTGGGSGTSPSKMISGDVDGSAIRAKFPNIRGRMYDEVLYLYSEVAPNVDHGDFNDKNGNNQQIHREYDREANELGVFGAASSSVPNNSATTTSIQIDDDFSKILSPMHCETDVPPSLRHPIGIRTQPSLNKPNSGRGYQSAASGHTSSEGYSSSDGFFRRYSKAQTQLTMNTITRYQTKQEPIYSIEELSDFDPTPTYSPLSLHNKERVVYQTDEEDFQLSPHPPISKNFDHHNSDGEYFYHDGGNMTIFNQQSDGEMTDAPGVDPIEMILSENDKLRRFRTSDRRGSIDKTEEALKEIQSSPQFWHLGGKEVFIFDFGAIVFWGYQRDEVKDLLHEFRQFIIKGRLSKIEFEAGEDDMAFVTSDEADNITIANDVIVLSERTTVQMRLAVSFAIAQSSILSIFEARIEEKIEEYKFIPETLALCGKVKLSQKELGNMIGEVFVIRHDVNLHSEILDIPDYFWKEQAIEPLYRMTMMYLEIEPRTEVVNKRLDLLRELLRLLQHQHENDHAVKLEWIVIWLIVVSVVLELMVIVGKLLNFDIE